METCSNCHNAPEMCNCIDKPEDPPLRTRSCNLCEHVGSKGELIRCDHPGVKDCEEADGISESFAEECSDYVRASVAPS